jgi:hypothetical protein
MNRFGEIADELTDLIEELDQLGLASEANGQALKAALMRAFAKACEAERATRLKAEREPLAEKRRACARRPVRAEAKPLVSGVVIELPLEWRRKRAAMLARRLDD